MTNIKFKRGNKANMPSSAPDGMPLWCSDTKELYIGTGNSVSQITGGSGGSIDDSLYQKKSEKNVPNGYVGLGADGMISKSYYDNVNVGLSTFLTSNAMSAPSASWKALGTTIYKSSYSDFYNDALSSYTNGTYYNVNYSSCATYNDNYSSSFLADWLEDSNTGELIATNTYQFDTELFTAKVYYPNGGSTASTFYNVLKYFLGKWNTSFDTSSSYRNTLGSMTISGSLEIELILKSKYWQNFTIKRFSRYLSGNYSSSDTYYTITCNISTTNDGINWTSAYSKSATSHWDATVSGSFIGIKLVASGTRFDFGYYTWDEANTPSVCRQNRYYYKAKTMSVIPKEGSNPTVMDNLIKQKNGFIFTKDFTYSTTTSEPTLPSSGIMNSNWILNGCYDFSILLSQVFKINTANQTVSLPSSANYNFVCVENSNLNIIEFYQTVINTYMKKNYENAEKPYVVYCSSSTIMFSNGFCIQKGLISKPSAAGSYTYTYPIAYSSYYFPMLTYYDSRTSNLYWPHLTSYDTTGFTYYFNTYNANATSYIVWLVYGFVSSSTVATYKAKNSFS